MDPIFIALGLGAAFLFFGKKKKTGGATVPTDDDDVVPGGGDQPGGGGGGGGGGAPVNAPVPFPGQNIQKEHNAIDAVHSTWMLDVARAMSDHGNSGASPTEADIATARGYHGVPNSRSVASWLTDKAFKALYPQVRKIPPESRRGSGWSGYVKAWTRMWEYAKGLTWTTVPGTEA